VVLLYCVLYWRGGGAVQAAATRCRVCAALDDVWGARFTMAIADPDCCLSHAGWNACVVDHSGCWWHSGQKSGLSSMLPLPAYPFYRDRTFTFTNCTTGIGLGVRV
jgi:hypothetical protein